MQLSNAPAPVDLLYYCFGLWNPPVATRAQHALAVQRILDWLFLSNDNVFNVGALTTVLNKMGALAKKLHEGSKPMVKDEFAIQDYYLSYRTLRSRMNNQHSTFNDIVLNISDRGPKACSDQEIKYLSEISDLSDEKRHALVAKSGEMLAVFGSSERSLAALVAQAKEEHGVRMGLTDDQLFRGCIAQVVECMYAFVDPNMISADVSEAVIETISMVPAQSRTPDVHALASLAWNALAVASDARKRAGVSLTRVQTIAAALLSPYAPLFTKAGDDIVINRESPVYASVYAIMKMGDALDVRSKGARFPHEGDDNQLILEEVFTTFSRMSKAAGTYASGISQEFSIVYDAVLADMGIASGESIDKMFAIVDRSSLASVRPEFVPTANWAFITRTKLGVFVNTLRCLKEALLAPSLEGSLAYIPGYAGLGHKMNYTSALQDVFNGKKSAMIAAATDPTLLNLASCHLMKMGPELHDPKYLPLSMMPSRIGPIRADLPAVQNAILNMVLANNNALFSSKNVASSLLGNTGIMDSVNVRTSLEDMHPFHLLLITTTVTGLLMLLDQMSKTGMRTRILVMSEFVSFFGVFIASPGGFLTKFGDAIDRIIRNVGPDGKTLALTDLYPICPIPSVAQFESTMIRMSTMLKQFADQAISGLAGIDGFMPSNLNLSMKTGPSTARDFSMPMPEFTNFTNFESGQSLNTEDLERVPGWVDAMSVLTGGIPASTADVYQRLRDIESVAVSEVLRANPDLAAPPVLDTSDFVVMLHDVSRWAAALGVKNLFRAMTGNNPVRFIDERNIMLHGPTLLRIMEYTRALADFDKTISLSERPKQANFRYKEWYKQASVKLSNLIRHILLCLTASNIGKDEQGNAISLSIEERARLFEQCCIIINLLSMYITYQDREWSSPIVQMLVLKLYMIIFEKTTGLITQSAVTSPEWVAFTRALDVFSQEIIAEAGRQKRQTDMPAEFNGRSVYILSNEALSDYFHQTLTQNKSYAGESLLSTVTEERAVRDAIVGVATKAREALVKGANEQGGLSGGMKSLTSVASIKGVDLTWKWCDCMVKMRAITIALEKVVDIDSFDWVAFEYEYYSMAMHYNNLTHTAIPKVVDAAARALKLIGGDVSSENPLFTVFSALSEVAKYTGIELRDIATDVDIAFNALLTNPPEGLFVHPLRLFRSVELDLKAHVIETALLHIDDDISPDSLLFNAISNTLVGRGRTGWVSRLRDDVARQARKILALTEVAEVDSIQRKIWEVANQIENDQGTLFDAIGRGLDEAIRVFMDATPAQLIGDVSKLHTRDVVMNALRGVPHPVSHEVEATVVNAIIVSLVTDGCFVGARLSDALAKTSPREILGAMVDMNGRPQKMLLSLCDGLLLNASAPVANALERFMEGMLVAKLGPRAVMTQAETVKFMEASKLVDPVRCISISLHGDLEKDFLFGLFNATVDVCFGNLAALQTNQIARELIERFQVDLAGVDATVNVKTAFDHVWDNRYFYQVCQDPVVPLVQAINELTGGNEGERIPYATGKLVQSVFVNAKSDKPGEARYVAKSIKALKRLAVKFGENWGHLIVMNTVENTPARLERVPRLMVRLGSSLEKRIGEITSLGAAKTVPVNGEQQKRPGKLVLSNILGDTSLWEYRRLVAGLSVSLVKATLPSAPIRRIRSVRWIPAVSQCTEQAKILAVAVHQAMADLKVRPEAFLIPQDDSGKWVQFETSVVNIDPVFRVAAMQGVSNDKTVAMFEFIAGLGISSGMFTATSVSQYAGYMRAELASIDSTVRNKIAENEEVFKLTQDIENLQGQLDTLGNNGNATEREDIQRKISEKMQEVETLNRLIYKAIQGERERAIVGFAREILTKQKKYTNPPSQKLVKKVNDIEKGGKQSILGVAIKNVSTRYTKLKEEAKKVMGGFLDDMEETFFKCSESPFTWHWMFCTVINSIYNPLTVAQKAIKDEVALVQGSMPPSLKQLVDMSVLSAIAKNFREKNTKTVRAISLIKSALNEKEFNAEFDIWVVKFIQDRIDQVRSTLAGRYRVWTKIDKVKQTKALMARLELVSRSIETLSVIRGKATDEGARGMPPSTLAGLVAWAMKRENKEKIGIAKAGIRQVLLQFTDRTKRIAYLADSTDVQVKVGADDAAPIKRPDSLVSEYFSEKTLSEVFLAEYQNLERRELINAVGVLSAHGLGNDTLNQTIIQMQKDGAVPINEDDLTNGRSVVDARVDQILAAGEGSILTKRIIEMDERELYLLSDAIRKISDETNAAQNSVVIMTVNAICQGLGVKPQQYRDELAKTMFSPESMFSLPHLRGWFEKMTEVFADVCKTRIFNTGVRSLNVYAPTLSLKQWATGEGVRYRATPKPGTAVFVWDKPLSTFNVVVMSEADSPLKIGKEVMSSDTVI